MIYFVTNNTNYYKETIDTLLFKDITVLNETEGKELFFTLLGKMKVLAVDLEATGLDPYKTTSLLYGVGTKNIQFQFDWTTDPTDIVRHLKENKVTVLGHNIKYDIKLLYVRTGIMLTKLYDTMIAEQRLYMRIGYGFSYADVVARYEQKAILKSVRNDFIGADINKFKINSAHIYYLRVDLVDLFNVREKQRKQIKRYKQQFLVYGIEFPLISIIAEAELEGFEFNIAKWLERVEKDRIAKFNLECELDDLVRGLRDTISINKQFKTIDPKITLGGNKFSRKRQRNPLEKVFKADGTTTELNIFGEVASHRDITKIKKKVALYPNNINYSFKKEIVNIFARLEQPMITVKETFVLPQIDKHGKLKGSVNDYTIKEDYLQKYILLKPNSIMIPFINGIMKHSKLEKAISTYGENFIGKLNPITGNLHTAFRQCAAVTGRFQSGGGNKEPDKINYQNIPANNEYRNCFTVDNTKYSIMTADYTGAELIVMASHAQDFKLIELSKGDMHSHMATLCWRAIFKHRARKLLDLFTTNHSYRTRPLVEEYNDYVEKFKTFLVTKILGTYRKDFKGMTFGTIYGMFAKKAGAVLNISVEEGAIVIKTIKKEIPRTFAMVEKASIDAEKKGHLILNNRTNSRAWFPHLIRKLKGEINEATHFRDIAEDLSAARNIRIQGTQADFVKEASVVLAVYFRKKDIDARILSWVHDELVIRLPRHLDGESPEFHQYILDNPNTNFISSTTGNKFNNLSLLVKDIMESVANRYLEGVTIQIDYHVKDTWIK